MSGGTVRGRRVAWRRLPFIALIAAAVLARGPAGRGSAATPPSPIRVVMREFAFRPTVIRLAAGVPATLELINEGQLAHQFGSPVLRRAAATVWDDDLHVEATDVEIVRLQPGHRARLSFVPRTRGRFRFTCSIEGHAEAGMAGVVDVR